MNDVYAECRKVLAEHSKSFSLAAKLFPPERRDEASAVYAWCRECDDAIDLAAVSDQPRALERLLGELDAIYAGAEQSTAVGQGFQAVVRARGIPRDYPAELLAGMAMDVENPVYASIDDLLLYCYRVAGTVGLMMCHVMGVARESATRSAVHLGVAMQITNVCRDVLEDWERGRLYVPAELLGADLASAMAAGRGGALPEKARGELAEGARQLLLLADRYYESADRGLGDLEPRSALAVRMARLVYAEIGREIERRDCDVLAGRAIVSRGRKLRLLGAALTAFARDLSDSGRRAMSVAPPREVLRFPEAVRLA